MLGNLFGDEDSEKPEPDEPLKKSNPKKNCAICGEKFGRHGECGNCQGKKVAEYALYTAQVISSGKCQRCAAKLIKGLGTIGLYKCSADCGFVVFKCRTKGSL